MSATPSTMVALGTRAPDFDLPDVVSGKKLSLSSLKGEKGTVIFFICNHCPYVKHVNRQLIEIALEYRAKGLGFLAISSNDAKQYPEDGPEEMKNTARRLRYPFPYLYDEPQLAARAYDAACTPDTFLFDKELKLVYRGQLDNSRPSGELPVTGRDLRQALDAVLNGKPVSPDQKPSVGCNIKWKQ